MRRLGPAKRSFAGFFYIRAPSLPLISFPVAFGYMNHSKVTPKDFFLWLGAVIGIYGSIFAFISLLFQYIDYAYPDALSYVDPFSTGIRVAMASLIVLAPAALILMSLIRKDIRADSSKKDLWIRRWAIVLTLFIAGLTVVGDLITHVNYFLGGDVTTRFILKVAVILLVASATFMHFIADYWGYWNQFPMRARYVQIAAGIAVVLSIVSGFLIMGTPSQVRLQRFDSQKVNDLQNIQYQVVNYWQQKQKMPMALTEVEDPISGYTMPLDPQTSESYRYEVTGAMSFKLCATFNANSSDVAGGQTMAIRAYGSIDGSWDHGMGEVCFDRTIDPERYPAFTKPAPTLK